MSKNVVVFDLDETLGYFSELGTFYDILRHYYKKKHLLNSLFDLYPEIFRPQIFEIIKTVKKMKNTKLIIYTNNQGPKTWAKSIMSYFEHKLGFKVFDHIVHAFKIGDKQIEMCRTSHDKSHDDFLKCTKIRDTCNIFFIDDQFHPRMKHPKVFYFHVKPYYYVFSKTALIERFIKSNLCKKICSAQKLNTETLKSKLHSEFYFNNVHQSSHVESHNKIAQTILRQLHIFYDKCKPKTKKRTHRRRKLTKKNKNVN